MNSDIFLYRTRSKYFHIPSFYIISFLFFDWRFRFVAWRIHLPLIVFYEISVIFEMQSICIAQSMELRCKKLWQRFKKLLNTWSYKHLKYVICLIRHNIWQFSPSFFAYSFYTNAFAFSICISNYTKYLHT